MMKMVKIINQKFDVLTRINGTELLKEIELAARTCYKSEDKISENDESAKKLIKMLITKGHYAMLEHGPSISVKFITDRGVSHELVRHRLASFAQESTRYCNYGSEKFGREITVIQPVFDGDQDCSVITAWENAMADAEKHYMYMLDHGASPQIARSVLPNSLKTEIIVKADITEWRHILKLRTDKAAHPQMRDLMTDLLKWFKFTIPVLFDDI